MVTWFKQFFDEEYGRFFLWWPVCFAVGIGVYFSLHFEPNLHNTITVWLCSLLLLWPVKRWLNPFYRPYFALCLAVFGFAWSAIHAHESVSPIIENSDKSWSIRAVVAEYEEREHGYRFYLTENDLWQYGPGKYKKPAPKVIRLNVRTNVPEDIEIGDYIQVKAFLKPPASLPSVIGGYDFARHAFFEQIGAVGYSVSAVTIREKGQSSDGWIKRFRHGVIEKIRSAFTEDQVQQSAVATALLTAERGMIDKDITESMRTAGISHLLAISGLHMALVMAGVFFFIRLIFATTPYLALRINTKKWAAIIALLVGFVYLLLTNFPVSAVRAYVMVSLFFLAVLLDRVTTPLRLVAIAAWVVLLVAPESLVGPSFQMSFAAVVALIGCYERLYQKREFNKIFSHHWFHKLRRYVGAILLTSLIAGLATSPFAMYHFGRFTTYNLLANLLAIPLASFWIMPLGVLALFLMPLGLHEMALNLMGKGIAWLVNYAHWIGELPMPVLLVPQFSVWALVLVSFGGLWLFLWQGQKRYLGIVMIVCSIVWMVWPKPVPSLVLDEEGKLFALKTSDGQLAFSSLTKARYARGEWLETFGLWNSLRIKDLSSEELGGFSCNEMRCQKRFDKGLVLISANKDFLTCDEANKIAPFLWINLQAQQNECNEFRGRVINKKQLLKQGTHLVFLEDDVKIKNVRENIGNRLWTAQEERAKH